MLLLCYGHARFEALRPSHLETPRAIYIPFQFNFGPLFFETVYSMEPEGLHVEPLSNKETVPMPDSTEGDDQAQKQGDEACGRQRRQAKQRQATQLQGRKVAQQLGYSVSESRRLN